MFVLFLPKYKMLGCIVHNIDEQQNNVFIHLSLNITIKVNISHAVLIV